jgi:hypothetical protein
MVELVRARLDTALEYGGLPVTVVVEPVAMLVEVVPTPPLPPPISISLRKADEFVQATLAPVMVRVPALVLLKNMVAWWWVNSLTGEAAPVPLPAELFMSAPVRTSLWSSFVQAPPPAHISSRSILPGETAAVCAECRKR